MNRVNLTLFLGAALFLYWWCSPTQTPPAPNEIEEEYEEDVEEPEQEEAKPQPQVKEKVISKPKVPSTPSSPTLKLKRPPAPTAGKYANLDKSFLPFDKDGNLVLTQVTVDGEHLTFQGDLLVGETKDLSKIKKRGALKMSRPKLWPSKKIPFSVEEGLPNELAIEEAIDFFNQNTNLEFVPRTNEKDYIHFKKGPRNCYSYVGFQTGRQAIVLSPQCRSQQICHELEHAVGFFHEQNRGDRDQHLEINWTNIDTTHEINFKKIPLDFMHLSGESFTFDTAMLYSSSAFASDPRVASMLTTSGNEIPPFPGCLSSDDIRRTNRVYP